MLEVNLVADLFIATLEGIKSKKQVKKFYDQYELLFDHDTVALEAKFDHVITTLAMIYPEGLSDTEFRRPHLFYSLFTAVAHSLFGLPGLAAEFVGIQPAPEAIRSRLERVDEIFAESDLQNLNKAEQQFLTDSRRATTDEKVRVRRTEFLLKLTT